MEVLFPPFRLDLAGERLWQGEREIRLRPKTFAVLRYLVERPGRLVSTGELLSAVWSGIAVTDVMPRLCVRELRSALGDDAHAARFIQTRPGRGYQFVAPVLPLTILPAGDRRHVADNPSVPGERPLVGRRADLEQLGAALERARGGEREVIFVSGEPGIGKSSLIEVFLSGLIAPDLIWAKGECVEQFGASEPYLPILAALERLCRSAAAGPLIGSLRRTAPSWLAQLPSLVEPAEHAALVHRLSGLTSQGMLRELASLLEALGHDHVVVIWLEDLHWADHSTVEAIAFLAQRSERARLMLLGTYRPSELLAPDPPLARLTHDLVLHGHGQEIVLRRLPELAVAEYLAVRFGGAPASADLVRHVHRRTDGNPLFMVTVADDLVGRALVIERGGQWSLEDTPGDHPGDVPDALRRLIEQQARRLAREDRRLLETASVAGIEFSAATVAAGLGEDPGVIERRCASLAQIGQFLTPRGALDWPDGTTAAAYGFLHALHRDVFYEGIPAGHRRQLHGLIAVRLERAFARRAPDNATELAMHFERARDTRRAVHYHRLAGETALGRAAHAEAIVHLSRALDLLEDISEGVQRSRLELGLLLALGPAWNVTKGYAATEVERTYSRALDLARKLGNARDVARALRGLWNVHLVRAELGTARNLAAELLARAKASRDPELLGFARAALGETLFHIGKLRTARAHLEGALAVGRGRAAAARTSQRPRVASFVAWGLWMSGYPDQARRLCSQAVTEARALARPHNRAFTLGCASIIHELCGEVSRVAELVDEQSAVCREHDIAYWQSWAEVLKGWVLARQGHMTEGLVAMRRAINAHRQTGAVVGVTHFLTLLAEIHGGAGEIEPGLQVADEALALAVRTGNRYVEPEIHRVRGELLLQVDRDGGLSGLDRSPSQADAERCFRQAIETARPHSARSFELRAATSLARLWQARGESVRARRLLVPRCRWFVEGTDTVDVRAARRLLAALEAPEPMPARAVRASR